jgi:hypothetical protein
VPVVSKRVQIGGHTKRKWGGREVGWAYPFHTCGGCVPDGLDEFAPILLLVNGCL